MAPYRTIPDHRRQYRTIWDHTGPNGTIQDNTGPYRTIRDQTGPYGTKRDHTSNQDMAIKEGQVRAVQVMTGQGGQVFPGQGN